jgi:hypothetical protein
MSETKPLIHDEVLDFTKGAKRWSRSGPPPPKPNQSNKTAGPTLSMPYTDSDRRGRERRKLGWGQPRLLGRPGSAHPQAVNADRVRRAISTATRTMFEAAFNFVTHQIVVSL